MEEIPLLYKQIYMFVIGSIVGSFLNVCIYRIPKGISIITPASHCPYCRYKIPFYLNIPIVGWFIVGGKCKNCKASLSIEYSGIEMLSALNFMMLYANYGLRVDFFFYAAFTSMCIVLAFIDLHHYILPDVITIPMILAGILFSLVTSRITLLESILAGAAGSFLLIAIYLLYLWVRKQEGLGLGDVKMIAGIGTFGGFIIMFVALFTAVISGALVGVALMVKKKYYKMDMQLPFGTFLGLASLFSLYWSDKVVKMYFHWSERVILNLFFK